MAVTGVGVDRVALLKDLTKQVSALEDDLRERSDSVEEFRTRLEREYQQARDGKRTGAMYGAWRDERVTQVAAAWVLGCLFVRFCEDNGLIEWPYLAGPGARLADAEERHEAFFREQPHLNNRDWLIAAFDHVAGANDTAAGLFSRAHNPLWEITPSYEAATELLRFWRRWGADGRIVHDFTDPEWDTRFLGDLYQDLSAHARKTYALLQTPEFVEEFILDLTLEPAIEEFGLDPVGEGPEGVERRGLRTIDPACGSGHFLLGIFERLLAKWRAAEPGTDDWTLVRRALESVHGCDKNPFAVSIARFRLLVAAIRAAGARRLAHAPSFPINVAVGDSLLHGRGAAGIQTDLGTLFEAESGGEGRDAFVYATEDVGDFAKSVDLLGRGTYHVVVGNPPYITVKDKRENENYRLGYFSCSGAYALSVPFAQRIFELAIRDSSGRGESGYTGQITSNSFMKREFGKTLIETFFPGGEYKDPRERVRRNFSGVHLTHVIDTSGAYIPGHGTPTVILVGRNKISRQSDPIRVVLGIRGEPSRPEAASRGHVWRAIVGQAQAPGSESEWVSADDVSRTVMDAYPWSLNGGGAADTFALIEREGTFRLKSLTTDLGFIVITGEDEAFAIPGNIAARHAAIKTRPLVSGERVRDMGIHSTEELVWPYGDDFDPVEYDADHSIYRHLWSNRTNLLSRKRFGVPVREIESVLWSEFREFYSRRLKSPMFLTYPFVSTHAHFSFSRRELACIRTAPVIKLPHGAAEDDYLGLLGVLNSSTACFWLKQVSQGKGGSGLGRGLQDEEWEERYEFTGTKLQEFPLSTSLPLDIARKIDVLAREMAQCDPSVYSAGTAASRVVLDCARAKYASTLRRMVAFQEELDWQVYGLYELLNGDEVAWATISSAEPESIPEVNLGERAFEIVLARKVAAGEADTAWFKRHRSTPVTEIPSRWPEWYRDIVQARIDIIESRKDIALVERPEYKRRWASEPWEKKERAALRTWLLDRIEEPGLWHAFRDGVNQPRPLTVSQLADELGDDADLNSVAQLFATDHLGKPDLPLAEVLAEVVADEHVPYLAAMRYKDSGLRNREQWERVWELQREEDRTGERLDIPVPPKYKGADFLKQSYWSNRGKLDVPKERFISYPEASPDADPTLLLGWAGWNHKDQAQALINLIEDRQEQAGWGTGWLRPLLAGLQEVTPWVRQWHGEFDVEWEGVPADDCEAYLEEQMAKRQVSAAELKTWRPMKRGRKKAVERDKAGEQLELGGE